MALKDFDELIRGRGRPVFIVAGQKFTCRANISFARLARLSRGMNDAEDETESAKLFFNAVLLGDDRGKFLALLEDESDDDDDTDAVIVPEQVKGILEWLMEHYTGKRLEDVTSSLDGPTSIPTPQNVFSLNPA